MLIAPLPLMNFPASRHTKLSDESAKINGKSDKSFLADSVSLIELCRISRGIKTLVLD